MTTVRIMLFHAFKTLFCQAEKQIKFSLDKGIFFGVARPRFWGGAIAPYYGEETMITSNRPSLMVPQNMR